MSEEQMPSSEEKVTFNVEEEMGYDAPFVTFTWAHWLEMQGQMVQAFTRFQRAITDKEVQLALFIVLDMQRIVSELQKEAYSWVGVSKK